MMEEPGLVSMRDVLGMLRFDCEMEVCDMNDETKWSGKVRQFPWAMTDVEVTEIDALGPDHVRVMVDDRGARW